ncbi:MAG: hypothetical protein B6D44_17180 [Ignavibacteriales bacterium UTCHB2]|jgi:hypothetical protein|nr:MAG: hypothetical protein BWY38_02742 [Ignavibacteria bacterium ADurb.Bin266]OQY69766.1 MAG: hypothetical protein B6D44_17180 [Ignavibacteriales bacterium UTCHB2]HQF37171.1 hypothetical protein [Candidatus Dojkabacteria bacterium]HQI42175.1 hypothetical protein [Ignavibacteriaceae bacterium]
MLVTFLVIIVLNISIIALIIALFAKGIRKILLGISIAAFIYLFIDYKFILLTHFLSENITNETHLIDYIFYCNSLSALIATFFLLRQWLKENYQFLYSSDADKNNKQNTRMNKNELQLIGGLILIGALIITIYHINIKDNFSISATSGMTSSQINYQTGSNLGKSFNDNIHSEATKTSKSEADIYSGEENFKANNDATKLNKDIEKLVNEYLYRNMQNSVDYILEIYADRVDFYGKGWVDKNFIIRDKINYFDKWPLRKYELISNLELTKGNNQNQWIVDFNYACLVSNNSRRLSGEAWCKLTIFEEERLKIISEKGGLIKKYN